MDTTPRGKSRPISLMTYEIADRWADWGWREDQHHCVLIAFFESWNGVSKSLQDYHALAKVLEDHYRQAVFPCDAKTNPFVYWLAGPNRHKEVSYVASREEFDERYLVRFGPLFDAVEWLKAYRADPRAAVAAISGQQLAGDPNVKPLADGVGWPQGSKNNVVQDHINTNKLSPRSAERIVRRLKRDHPAIAAALGRGEYPSARAAGIAAGFIKQPSPLDIIRVQLAKLDATQRDTVQRWLDEMNDAQTNQKGSHDEQ